jgi:bifunctional non-homologous end joining protein LigD
MTSSRHHELVFFAFDLLHRDGQDLVPIPLTERRRRLTRLISRSDVPCLHLVEAFEDGAKLLELAERMREEVEGTPSLRRVPRLAQGQGARQAGNGGGYLSVGCPTDPRVVRITLDYGKTGVR